MKRPLPPLITKEEALARLFAVWRPEPEVEIVPLSEAAGRVLARDWYAAYDIPVVRASAMDGIAVRSADFAGGIPDTAHWQLGLDYVRADTGDDFDDAYDAVIAIEDVTFPEGGGVRLADGVRVTPGENVVPRGTNVQKGALLASRGTVLTAGDLAAIGMGGAGEVPVVKKPRVAFIPSGSELVPVGAPLQRGQNFDTNSILAAQMLRDMGAEPLLWPIVPDEPEALREALERALEQADIVLLNAGTSKGKEDHCARLLETRGQALFHGVAAVPGRPMSMAVADGKPVVNFSGPSVAAYHSLDWAVRAIVCRALGIDVPARPTVRAVLTGPVTSQRELSRMCALRVERSAAGYTASPISNHGAKTAVLTANGVYITRPGERSYEAGDMIEVELIR